MMHWLAVSYQYPFIQPLPVWDVWYLLLLPLCVAISIVYKSVKCATMQQVPREAASITFWILLGMVTAGAALALIVAFTERT